MSLNLLPNISKQSAGEINQKLHWLSRKIQIIGENIAHADVPFYQKKTLAPFGERGRGHAIKTTHPMHFAGNYSPSAILVKSNSETGNDIGNGVNLEEELAELEKYKSEYNKILNLYKHRRKLTMSVFNK